ncbi:MAG: ABC transporter permease, partial [Xanthomonadales bacterium]|nr:ABC transporter permease [Xanthomonadales bacterium]
VQLGQTPAEELAGLAVSRNYFEVLGTGLAGSLAAEGPAVVLSQAAAQRWPELASHLGEATLRIDGVPHLVVGLAPVDQVDPLGRPWLYQIEPAWFSKDRRQDLDVAVVVRSAEPAVTRTARLQALSADLASRYPETHQASELRAVALTEHLLGPLRSDWRVLLAGTGLLLMLVLANATALDQARLQQGVGALRTRSALGERAAVRWRAQWVEALLLLAVATLPAAALVLAGLAHSAAVLSAGLPRAVDVWPQLPTWLKWGGLLALLATLQATLAGWRAGQLLRRSGGAQGQRVQGLSRAQGLLLVGQCALALCLLGAGLAVAQRAYQLGRVDPGFSTGAAWQSRLMLSHEQLPDAARQRDFVERLQQSLQSLPDLDGVALANQLPLDGGSTGAFIGPVEGPTPTPANAPLVQVRSVTDGYFQVLGIPLVAGRGFAATDTPEATAVAIIDESLARRLFGDRPAVGQQVIFEGLSRLVVGVSAPTRDLGLGQVGRMTVHLPLAQDPASWRRRSLSLIAHARTGGTGAGTVLTTALQPFADEAVIGRVEPLDALVAAQLQAPRWRAGGFGMIAMIATLLAAFGAGSIAALLLAYRRGEFAICRALGATPTDILIRAGRWLVQRILLGSLLGVLGAAFASRALQAWWPDVALLGWPLAGAVLVLLAGCALALSAPLRSAMTVPPGAALRGD